MVKKKKLEIYVDGSYSRGMVGFGWAAFSDDAYFCGLADVGGLHLVAEEYTVRRNTYKERNVAGEAKAMIEALNWYSNVFCDKLGNTDYLCSVFFDYSGLQNWKDGSWRANSRIGRWYRACITPMVQKWNYCASVKFVKLKGHSGNVLHDYVDKELRSLLRSAVAEEKNKKKTKKSKVVV